MERIMIDGVVQEVDETHKFSSKNIGLIISDNDRKLQKIEEMKAERTSLLFDTDWTQLPDVPDTIKNKYKTYRQELRDLPSVDGFPDVDMPTKPS